MAGHSLSFLLCSLLIVEAIGNPVILTNRVRNLRQHFSQPFSPSHFKDFPDVDYIFLPDLSQDFDAFDYESVPLDSEGNSFFPSIEFNSKRSREEDEFKKVAPQNIFPPNQISNNNEEKVDLGEISSQASSSSFQSPSDNIINKPTVEEPSRSDRLLSSIIGGIKKDIFSNKPFNNRIQQEDSNKNAVKPIRGFPVAQQVSENISIPTKLIPPVPDALQISKGVPTSTKFVPPPSDALQVSESIAASTKVAPPENHDNIFQTQPSVSRSTNLLSMIVKGIKKDIFPSGDKRIENSPPQFVPKPQSFVQESNLFSPVRKDFPFEANPSRTFEHKVLPSRQEQNPQSVSETQFINQNSKFFTPIRKDFTFEQNPSRTFEHKVLPGTPQQTPQQTPQSIIESPSFVQQPNFFNPVIKNFPFEANPSRIFEHKVLQERLEQNTQSISKAQSFPQQPQFFRPIREDFTVQENPRTIFEHRILPGRQEHAPNKLEHILKRQEQVLQRQEHFQENRQHPQNLSRSQLLLENILGSIQRDIFERQRFI